MKPIITVLLFGMLFLQLAPAPASASHEITRWRHNHGAAVSVTFDDGLQSQATTGVDLLNARGIKGSFYIMTNSWNQWPTYWADWLAVAEAGHEIGSHTIGHVHLPDLADEQMRDELFLSQSQIEENIPIQPCLTIAYPYGEYSDPVVAATSERYMAGRTVWSPGYLNFYPEDPAEPVDFFRIGSFPFDYPEVTTFERLSGLLDSAEENSAWFLPHIHRLDDPNAIDVYTRFLDDILSRDLWIAPLGSVVKYMKERIGTSIRAVDYGTWMSLTLLSHLDPALYNEPLTLRSTVPLSWEDVEVSQGDSTVVVSPVMEGLEAVIYFDVIPGEGEIILTPGTIYNMGPEVDAGQDLLIAMPTSSVQLNGTVEDDGLPEDPGFVTVSWSLDSGPGPVVFQDPAAADTLATFQEVGTYVLRLSADDGELVESDTIQVEVVEAGGELRWTQIPISGYTDDVEEGEGGIMFLNSSDLELVYDSYAGAGNQVVGLRFKALDVPPGVTIISATIQFQVDETVSLPGELQVQGQDIGNSPQFSWANFNLSSRTRTSASITWTPDAWSQVGQAGPSQRTPNLAPIVQSIVDRSDWAEGNALTFIISGSGTRVAVAYDANPSGAAVLDIEYALVPPANHAPEVDAGPDKSVFLPQTSVLLEGEVDDDGLPIPPGMVNILWHTLSGPGSVEFEDAAEPRTIATFSEVGTYVLELVVDDGEVISRDQTTVTINEQVVENQAPLVDAGPDLSLLYPQTSVTLGGSIWDDGLPAGSTLTGSWSLISGPAPVLISSPSSPVTEVTLAQVGTYVLELSGSDGALTSADQVTLTLIQQGSVSGALEVRISSGSDDAEEGAGGMVYLDSSDLELVYDTYKNAGNQQVGLRFAEVEIPQGSTITRAYIQFMVDETIAESGTLSVRAQAGDNPPTFSMSSSNISSRPVGSSVVTWVPALWPVVGAAGQDQQTPDLTPIVQEIVNRPGWSEGNAMAFLITGTGRRTAVAWESYPSGAPMLHLEFVTPPPGNRAPLVSAGEDRTIYLPQLSLTLEGQVGDDGLPLRTPAVLWTRETGPQGVVFSQPESPVTQVTFPETGVYSLRLSADDGELSAQDLVVVRVLDEAPPQVVAFETRVSAGSDDAEEASSGTVYLDSSDLELVNDTYNDAGNQLVGVRFNQLQLPKDAVISHAWVRFQVDEVTIEPCQLTVHAQDSGNAPGFEHSSFNLSSRPLTQASVSWAPSAWTVVDQSGELQQTPDLSTLLEEVVSRDDWAAGNSLVLIFSGTGRRTAEAWDGVRAAAPLLQVEYLLPAGAAAALGTGLEGSYRPASEISGSSSSIQARLNDLGSKLIGLRRAGARLRHLLP